MAKKSVVALLLAAGLLMSGCGKKEETEKKKSKKTKDTTIEQSESTEKVAPATTKVTESSTEPTTTEPVRPFMEVSDEEMQNGFEEELQKQLPGITDFRVDIDSAYWDTTTDNPTKIGTGHHEKYHIDVTSISVEDWTVGAKYIFYTDYSFSTPTSYSLVFCVQLRVQGTVRDSDEAVDDIFYTVCRATRDNLLVDIDGNVIGGSDFYYDFAELDFCLLVVDYSSEAYFNQDLNPEDYVLEREVFVDTATRYTQDYENEFWGSLNKELCEDEWRLINRWESGEQSGTWNLIQVS